MANITRRAALVGALVSSATLSVPIGRSLAAVRPRTVPDIAAELQEALAASGESWQVVVTADDLRINAQPLDPWQQLVAQCDVLAVGHDGWRLDAGRSIWDHHPTRCHLWGIHLEDFEERGARGKLERHTDLGVIA